MELTSDFKDYPIITTYRDTLKVLKLIKYNQSDCRLIIDKDGSCIYMIEIIIIFYRWNI